MTNFLTYSEIRKAEGERVAQAERDQKLRDTRLNQSIKTAESEKRSVLLTVWQLFASAHGFYWGRVETVSEYSGFTLKAEVDRQARYRLGKWFPRRIKCRVSFVVRSSWDGGLVLLQPRNWMRASGISSNAEDLAEAIHKATGKTVTLIAGDTIVYRAQHEHAEEIVPLTVLA